MEKYNAIYKCINDKLEENEILLEHYRDETSKQERQILELEEENETLKSDCSECKEVILQLMDEIKRKDKVIEYLKKKLSGGKDK